VTEAPYTSRMKRRLEAEGALVIKYRPGNGQRAGVPDCYVAHPEWRGWIEVKWGRGRLRPVQRSVCEMLQARGVSVLVLRGPDHIIEDLDGNELARLDLTFPLIPQLPCAHHDH